MHDRIGIFIATAANAVIFANDLIEAGGSFISMLLGVMP